MPVTTAADSGKENCSAPMPGLVVSIAVAEGQEVKAGENAGGGGSDGRCRTCCAAERETARVKKIHAAPGRNAGGGPPLILEFA